MKGSGDHETYNDVFFYLKDQKKVNTERNCC